MSQRLIAAVVAGPLVAALLLLSAFMPLPYVIYRPGLTVNVLGEEQGREIVQVDGAESYYDGGTAADDHRHRHPADARRGQPAPADDGVGRPRERRGALRRRLPPRRDPGGERPARLDPDGLLAGHRRRGGAHRARLRRGAGDRGAGRRVRQPGRGPPAGARHRRGGRRQGRHDHRRDRSRRGCCRGGRAGGLPGQARRPPASGLDRARRASTASSGSASRSVSASCCRSTSRSTSPRTSAAPAPG